MGIFQKHVIAYKRLYFYLAHLIGVVILFFPMETGQPGPIPFFDKYVHMTLFSLLSFFSINNFKQRAQHTMTLLIIYAIISEIIQEAFISGRHYDPFDIGADTVGVFLGCMIFNVLIKKIDREKQ